MDPYFIQMSNFILQSADIMIPRYLLTFSMKGSRGYRKNGWEGRPGDGYAFASWCCGRPGDGYAFASWCCGRPAGAIIRFFSESHPLGIESAGNPGRHDSAGCGSAKNFISALGC